MYSCDSSSQLILVEGGESWLDVRFRIWAIATEYEGKEWLFQPFIFVSFQERFTDANPKQ